MLVIVLVVLRPGNGSDASAAGHDVQTPFFRQTQNDQNRNDGEDEKDGFPHSVTSCDGLLPPEGKHCGAAWQTSPFRGISPQGRGPKRRLFPLGAFF